MRILVLGASGFIGSRLVVHLGSRGHSMVCAGRNPKALGRRFPQCEAVHADLRVDEVDDWRPRLVGINAMVNAAGILRGDLDPVHHRGPAAMFEACAEVGVRRLVQISALGAGAQPGSHFLTTKAAADADLLRLARGNGELRWCVLRPSLVIGRGGFSTALFCAMGAMPFPIRLGPGNWRVQPLHAEDAVCAVADLLAAPAVPEVLDLVGPEEITTDELTAILRKWLGLPPAPPLPVPRTILAIGARISDLFPGLGLSTETLSMLEAGNTADPSPIAATLGWMPRRLSDALAAEPSFKADLWLARLLPLRGILISVLFAVWVGSGLTSFLLPPQRADDLLAGVGLSGPPALALTWTGAALDVVLGVLMLHPRWRRKALDAQLGVMAIYTVLATIALPGLWADPFGALLKNLAVLAAILALRAIEDRP